MGDSKPYPEDFTKAYILSGESAYTSWNCFREHDRRPTYWPLYQLGVLEQRWKDEEEAEKRATELLFNEESVIDEDKGSEHWELLASRQRQQQREDEDRGGVNDGASYAPSESGEYETDWEGEDDWTAEEGEDMEDVVADVDETINDAPSAEETSEDPLSLQVFALSSVSLKELEIELADIRADGSCLGNHSLEDRTRGAQDCELGQHATRLESRDLEFELAVCQGRYNPDEIVELVAELYKTFIDMAHEGWEEDLVSFYPHTNAPIDTEVARSLGYSDSAIYVLERLPYFKDRPAWHNEDQRVISETCFMRYNDPEDLKAGRFGPCRGDWCSETIDPWMVPLTYSANRYGHGVALDTKLGTIRVCAMDGPWTNTPEAYRLGYSMYDVSPDHPIAYRVCAAVPAAKYLRTFIDTYRSLERLPNMDPQHADPSEATPYAGSQYSDLNDEIIEKQQALLRLYAECGWPDSWDRALFKERYCRWQEGSEKARYERVMKKLQK